MEDLRVVVLGAGVIGLTTALQLARAGYTGIRVMAKYLPTDRDPEYTSPWAGAIYVPTSRENTPEQEWESTSWKELCALAKTEPDAGVWIQSKSSFYCDETHPKDTWYDWWKDLVYDYHHLPKSAIPEFADWGIKYRTVALDPDTYLSFLQRQCQARGVSFQRGEVKHIREAFLCCPEPVDIVINCAGLNVRYLGGVEDKKVFPVRGQLVIVENEGDGMYFMPHNKRLGMGASPEESAYVIGRPLGKGTALGGTHYKLQDAKRSDLRRPADMKVAEDIMRKAIKICPSLVPPGTGIEALKVIRHQVGFRAHREGGTRLELEELQDDTLGPLKVVHCYGVGGAGYQLSYGVGDQVVKIVKTVHSSRQRADQDPA